MYDLARANALAVELDLAVRHPVGKLHGAIVAQKLFDRAWNQRLIFSKLAELIGIAKECQEAIPNEMRGGLQSGMQEQRRVRGQFFSRKSACAILCPVQSAQQSAVISP